MKVWRVYGPVEAWLRRTGRKLKKALAWGLAVVLAVAVAVLVVKLSRNVQPGQGAAESSGVVAGVVDGDTVRITTDGDEVTVRLLGIDAPEIAHGSDPADCGGPEAKTALAELLPVGTEVTVTTDPVSDQADRYGRTLAYVAAPGVEDVALELIERGLVAAWVPDGEPEPTRYQDYEDAQNAAQEASEGSWRLCGTLGR
jgi:micrococcal nuclease